RMLIAAFDTYGSQPQIVQSSCRDLYVRAGWDLDDEVPVGGGGRIPTWDDLIRAVRGATVAFGSTEAGQVHRAGLLTKIETLKRGALGRFLAAEAHAELPSELWRRGKMVFELAHTENDDFIRLALVAFMQQDRAWLATEPP